MFYSTLFTFLIFFKCMKFIVLLCKLQGSDDSENISVHLHGCKTVCTS